MTNPTPQVYFCVGFNISARLLVFWAILFGLAAFTLTLFLCCAALTRNVAAASAIEVRRRAMKQSACQRPLVQGRKGAASQAPPRASAAALLFAPGCAPACPRLLEPCALTCLPQRSPAPASRWQATFLLIFSVTSGFIISKAQIPGGEPGLQSK